MTSMLQGSRERASEVSEFYFNRMHNLLHAKKAEKVGIVYSVTLQVKKKTSLSIAWELMNSYAVIECYAKTEENVIWKSIIL